MSRMTARDVRSRPLRIAVVAACPFPTLQGSQVLIRQHAQAMAARGHDVHIVAYHLGLPSQALRAHRPQGGRLVVHRIPSVPLYKRMRSGPSIGKPILDALLMLKLLLVALRAGVDVFHAHNVEGMLAAWPVARLLGKPLVFHTHTLMEGELPVYFKRRLPRRLAAHAGRWLDRHLPRWADRTVVLSPEARAAFARLGASSDRLVYSPPGIEDGAASAPIDAPSVRARYGLGDGPLAIYTGNLDPYQGLDDLLDAFARVRRAAPQAQLVIASHATPDPTLDLTGEGVRYIRVSDFAEAAALLAASDVAVCPRPACLGFPIKLLNYMSAGLAIVCAEGSARGLKHLENGYIYSDGDRQALASALLRLLHDASLARELGRRAYSTSRRLRWSTLAESFELLYHELIQGAAAPRSVHTQPGDLALPELSSGAPSR